MRTDTKPDWIAGQLEAAIRRGRLPNRTRLPPIKTLALRYGVSYGTVQAALKVLAAKGLICLVDGSGSYVRAGPAARGAAALEPGTLAFKPRAAEIEEAVVADILDGRYRLGTHLPAQKALRLQYRTSNATLKAALEHVRRRKLIHRRGRGFIVGAGMAVRPGRAQGRIYVVGAGQQFEVVGHHRLSRDFIRSFESEVDRSGVPGIRVLDPVQDSGALDRALADKATLGFLHLGVGVTGIPPPAEQRLQRDVNRLVASGLPVVVFTYNDLLLRFPSLKVKIGRNVFLHWTDNAGAGEAVGAYLASLGHRRVAWLTFYGSGSWAQARLKGFRAGFGTAAGPRAEVRTFGPTAPRAYSSTRNIDAPLDRLVAEFRTEHGLSESAPTYRFRFEAYRMVAEDKVGRAMEPYFAEALADKTVTAWACSDENLAVSAVDFLRKRGARIPEDMSVIGINNDEDAFVRRVTTYDFLKRHLGYLAAHCILGDIPVRMRRGRLLLCPGQIVERGSVRRRSEPVTPTT
ncbi:MAG: GntR family transcriptional regulator [Kiritimatiellae bacterium]|nr:GntR family transcriptional regulator [Kiritimatiellia bacterium]